MPTKKILIASLLIVVLVAGVGLVASRASTLPAAPPGIDPAMWHPISDRLGIEIRDASVAGRTELYGTFMIRDGATWRRLNVSPGPPGVVPAR